MSFCVRHEACPNCGPLQDGSGDNLGVFSDGHKWCFACGFYIPSDGVVNLQEMRSVLEKRRKQSGVGVRLPADFTYHLPPAPKKWLDTYKLTDEEITKSKMGWSESYERLIYPIYDAFGNLLMYQGRSFAVPIEGRKHSKYHTEGQPEHIDVFVGLEQQRKHHYTMCCVVEDYISAIKIARICPALVLWGSELSVTRIQRISGRFLNVTLWLDKDKASYQAKCEIKARPYFERVSGIYTDLDPKCYSTEEIRKCLPSL